MHCKQSFFILFTIWLHVMQRTVLLSKFCLSVCLSICPFVYLSVRRVYCDKTKWRTADILIPHETTITVVVWHQQWLVGDAPSSLKSALKVTHPLRKRWRMHARPWMYDISVANTTCCHNMYQWYLLLQDILIWLQIDWHKGVPVIYCVCTVILSWLWKSRKLDPQKQ